MNLIQTALNPVSVQVVPREVAAIVGAVFEEEADKVVYPGPDTALLADLRPVEALLERHSVVLPPYLLRPEDNEPGVLDNAIGALKHGI